MGLFSSVKKAVKSVTQGPVSLVADKLGMSNLYNGLSSAGATGGLSGVVGVGSDMLQSWYNTAMQKDLAQYNAQQQSLLNDRAFQQNLAMWNLKNAYDSPAEQMKRFEAAGLNKNLIYGQSNTSGATPTMEAAKFDTGEYNPVDTRMQRQQMQLALAEHQQRVINQSIENDLARQRLALAERDADRSDRLVDAQIKNLNANLGLTNANTIDKLHNYQSFLGRHFGDIGKWYDRLPEKSTKSSAFDLKELMKGL